MNLLQVSRYIHLNGHIAQVKYTIDFTAQKGDVEEYALAIPAKQVRSIRDYDLYYRRGRMNKG